jgi:hypothetical protein
LPDPVSDRIAMVNDSKVGVSGKKSSEPIGSDCLRSTLRDDALAVEEADVLDQDRTVDGRLWRSLLGERGCGRRKER